MIDTYISAIEKMRDEGAVVLIKWDGLRALLRHTVVVTRADPVYVWHQDCDDISRGLQEAIENYRKAHSS